MASVLINVEIKEALLILTNEYSNFSPQVPTFSILYGLKAGVYDGLLSDVTNALVKKDAFLTLDMAETNS